MIFFFFFFQAEDGIRDGTVTGVQTCALPILLMDEPFGAIDPITRARLQDEFLRILRALKKTIVFVTHDVDEALKMGDRIAILKEGSLIQYDTPEAILIAPVDTFVEAFVGADRALK